MKPTFLDRPPPGWFVLDVLPWKERGSAWVALVTDVDPDEHRPGGAANAFVRIPGRHRSRDAAWDALDNMMATRH